MRIKKGDNVKVVKGKDRGKTGKVLQAFPENEKIVVEGVNSMSKHMKVRKQGEKGQKIEFNGPINAANVLVICPKCSKPTRLGTKAVGEGKDEKKVRVCKKCKEVIE